MTNFWNNKTLNNVVRLYLDAALDEGVKRNSYIVGMQPMNVEGMADLLCKDITIKNNVKTFVADYFDDAIDTVTEMGVDYSFRYSQYERVASMMLFRAAKEVLSQCETMQRYDDTYHIWKVEDIEALRNDLEDTRDVGFKFQRSCDLNFESLDSYTYRFLDVALPTMVGKTVKLNEIADSIPLVSLSEQESKNFLKSNFTECMKLLDEFRDSGYKVDYTNPVEMIQHIMYQKQKEILANNPLLEDAIEYSGIDTVTLDEEFIDDLMDSLKEQSNNIKLCKFEEKHTETPTRTGQVTSGVGRGQMGQLGRVIDLRKSNNRVEIIY